MQVQTHSPLKVVKIEKPLYELKQFNFTVLNPFLVDCEFSLSLEPKQMGITGDLVSMKAKASKQTDAHRSMQCIYPPPFGVAKQLMKLAKGAEEKVRASFLSFTPGLHRCLVWFTDVEHGCFCYEFVGQALNPAVYSEHEFTVDVKAKPMLIPVSAANVHIDNAKKVWLQQHPLAKDKEWAKLIKTRLPSVWLYHDKRNGSDS